MIFRNRTDDDLDLPTLEADVAEPDKDASVVEVDVAAGTQSGDTITVKGRGVPRLRGPGRGDLKVQVVVETPTKVDDDQRALLERLAASVGIAVPHGVLSMPFGIDLG